MLTILSKIFGRKSLIFLTVIAVLLSMGGLLYYRYDSVKESLILANKEIESVVGELRISEESIKVLEGDFKLVEELLVDKQEQVAHTQKLASDLSRQLDKERRENEDLQECLPVDMSGYVERVLEFSSYQNSDRSEGGDAE